MDGRPLHRPPPRHRPPAPAASRRSPRPGGRDASDCRANGVAEGPLGRGRSSTGHGLVALLASEPTIDIVGEAGDGREAVRLVERLGPDVALLDLRMPVLDGVGATAEIVGGSARTRVLILTTYDTDADIERGVEAGATGYLLKDATREQLVEAIHAASRGETVLASRVAQRLVARMRQPVPVALTARESEVLNAVADGLSNAEIGRRLIIGEATVKTHLLRIFAKLDVSDRTRAVVVAMDNGLLQRR
ncbi:response regulator [Streptomyces sp. NPDC056352]|uniref:response regulator n=1 Tax=Streptomyces sp. NPDC056352 TaxID=3345791 RepID=UPI0035D99FE5